MVTGGLIATRKDGQAIVTVWTGSRDVLNQKHRIRRQGNIVFSFATDTTAILPTTLLLIVWTTTSF